MPIKQWPIFAFLSGRIFAEQGDYTVVQFLDERTGDIVLANFVGAKISGFPAIEIRGGELERPPDWEAYVCIGEVKPGELVRQPYDDYAFPALPLAPTHVGELPKNEFCPPLLRNQRMRPPLLPAVPEHRIRSSPPLPNIRLPERPAEPKLVIPAYRSARR